MRRSESSALSAAERLKIIEYIISAREEIEKLDAEIMRLDPEIDFDIEKYGRYKRLLGARQVMADQIHDCAEALRTH